MAGFEFKCGIGDILFRWGRWQQRFSAFVGELVAVPLQAPTLSTSPT
jgi:hypothetical protein